MIHQFFFSFHSEANKKEEACCDKAEAQESMIDERGDATN